MQFQPVFVNVSTITKKSLNRKFKQDKLYLKFLSEILDAVCFVIVVLYCQDLSIYNKTKNKTYKLLVQELCLKSFQNINKIKKEL